MPRAQWTWAPDPKKVKMPILMKVKVEHEMNELIENVLRKKYLKKAPKNEDMNYIVDLYSKRHRQYFYFCAKYHCRSKRRIADYFETKFARMEYTPAGYELAYMRHTGKWRPLYQGLSLKEALQTIADGSHFEP